MAGKSGSKYSPFQPSRIAKQVEKTKKKRGQGGEISIPVPETNDELKEKLKMKIASGEYTVGELIVPRKVHVCLYNLNAHVAIINGRQEG